MGEITGSTKETTMFSRVGLFAIAVLVAACTPKPYEHELDLNHPANPEAAPGKASEPSGTLAIGGDISVNDKARTNSGQKGTHYECPMHPEITSPDPSRRCPKCDMKINKPVDDGGSPTGHEGHGGHNR